MNKTDSELIDQAGGTGAVAKLCHCRPASVSEWRRRGIPSARRMFLELARPDVFGKRSADDADELGQDEAA